MGTFFFFCIRKVQEKLSQDLAKFLKVILSSLCCCCFVFFFLKVKIGSKEKLDFPPMVLEKEMATHSSILAWKMPRTEEPGGLQS